MSRCYPILAGGLVLIGALAFSIPAFGQVEAEDHGYSAKTIEPGDATTMDDVPRPAALGSGVTVMRFTLTDIDPQADDPSDVKIDEFRIQNLGSADETDIAEIMCLDEDGNAVAPLLTSVNPGPNANVGFSATCELDGFVIPDGESETFEIAVRTVGTNELEDDDQNNTIRLRVTTTYSETVGSPPTDTDFTTEVTDSAAEHIYNGGINDVSEGSFGVDSLMPGEQGVVSRFTVCDDDSNEHNLVLDQLRIKQGEDGTALFTDISSLEIYRIDNIRRTQLGTLTPDAGANRGGASDALLLPTSVFIQDDTCTTFEIEAQINPFAFKGKVIQLSYQLSAQEPVNFDIDESVDRELVSSQLVSIGKGLVRIPDAVILSQRSGGGTATAELPIEVQGIPLPGFGALQVGPKGAVSFNPDVLRVTDIVGADIDGDGTNDYVVEATDIDNQRGEARFTVRATQSLVNRVGDSTAQPDERPVQNGPVAYVRVETVGDPGQSTRMTIQFDEFKDAHNQVLTEDVGTDAGLVEVVAPGDVDQDGSVAVNDALFLARQLTNDCEDLSDKQKLIADVAEPRASTDEIPVCGDTLTSADAARIARIAIDGSTTATGIGSNRADTEPTVEALSVSRIQTSLFNQTLDVQVNGQGIARTELAMYNLSGHRVFQKSSIGSTLQARLQTDAGQPLANGVYLYQVTVRGADGQVERSGVRKLVVMR
ncbi:MAG: hypothetical protein ABEK03_10135 [Candidatus Bipolaricaulia bacterium]